MVEFLILVQICAIRKKRSSYKISVTFLLLDWLPLVTSQFHAIFVGVLVIIVIP